MEPNEVIWEGKVGQAMLRVGVPHAGLIIAEWDSPQGSRHKISKSLDEFERSVLFQLLLAGGVTEENATEEVLEAVRAAQAERPSKAPSSEAPRKRKSPRARQHRRSRTPPRRR